MLVAIPSRFQELWPPRGHRLRSWASVHLQGLASLLQPPRGLRKSHIWVSSTVQPARQSGRSRTLGGTFGVSATRTNTAGTVSFSGPSTHRIHSVNTPLVSPPSSAYSDTNPPCSPGTGNHRKFQPWTSGSERVRGSGTQQLQQAVRRQRTQADAHRLSTPPYQPGWQGLVIHTGHPSPAAMSEAESPVHRSFHHQETNKLGFLPAGSTTHIPHHTHLSRHLTETSHWSFVSFFPRAWRVGSTSSSWKRGIYLQG